MSRAARRPKTVAELESMSLDELNAALSYLDLRVRTSGASVLKDYEKEIAALERARQNRFGVVPHRRRR
ncbi:MAG TPA: hypothetical protein VE010_06600 [Thermoanaerobaculia bacterium]|nr:hypothetical protein [Thermoanaerobaculia bacterium]